MALKPRLSLNKLLISFFLIVCLIFVACDGGGGEDEENPAPNPGTTLPGAGAIQGNVISSNRLPLNGVHIRAVNVNNQNIQISAFSGIGPNLTFQDGVYRIDGIPQGDYLVLIERLDGRSTVFDKARYSDFVESDSPLLSFPDEYFNGDGESSTDNPPDSVKVTVVNGQTTQGINFITND